MKCTICKGQVVKDGKTSKGVQRYRCKACNIRFQDKYLYQACSKNIDNQIVTFITEGVGVRSISRILKISPTTVLKRVKSISRQIQKPPILFGREYEMDELYTYIGNKNRRVCIAYAIDRKTREVVGFSVGRRSLSTLKVVTESLIISGAKEIRTDKLNLYKKLIPESIHHVKRRGINYIERKNLTLRTHLKRLNRRTISYSKSSIILSAILKIYFWS